MFAGSRVRRLLPIVLLSCCVGCVSKSSQGDATVYSYALWAPLLTVVGAAAAFFAGLKLRHGEGRQFFWAWAMLIGAPIGAIVMAPGMLLDGVRVDKEGFTARTGLWFNSTSFDVKFADTDEFEVKTVERRGRRGSTSTDTTIHCKKENGERLSIPASDLLKDALPEIMERARAAGFGPAGMPQRPGFKVR